MSDGPDALSIGGIVGGILSLLAAIGAAVQWLVSRSDTRADKIEVKEAELVEKLERRVDALEEDNRRIWLALSYVVPALHAHDPLSPALRHAAKILGDAFPIDLAGAATPVSTPA